jgi:F-type H+-transporting ATPase subunit delta
MSSVTAAKRYAKGLLQVGIETGKLEAIRTDMQYIRDAVKSAPMLQKILISPIVKEEKKKSIVQEVLEGKVTDITLKLVDILAGKNRFGLLYNVATSFQEIYNQHAGILEITIITAFELEKSQVESMVKAMEKTTGMTIQYTIKTDIALIGGVAIKYGDTVIDGSVRNKLEQLTDLLQVSAV